MKLNSLKRKAEAFASCYNVNLDLWFDYILIDPAYLLVLFGYSDKLWVAREFISIETITRREVTETLHRLIRSLADKVIIR